MEEYRGRVKTSILGQALAASLVTCLGMVMACGDDSKNAASSSSGDAGNGSSSSSGSSSTSSSGSSGSTLGPGTMHAGCRIFPNDNPWNTDVSQLPVDAELMEKVFPDMSTGTGIHPDWGTESDHYGIPITVGKASTPVKISFKANWGEEESDKLACPSGGGEFCYPIPLDAKTEGNGEGDQHVLFLATDGAPDHCVLYELFNTQVKGGGFSVDSSAIFHLDSNALRTEGWTSADAAGLPILPGLVRREEIVRGEITHALRFTMSNTRNGYIHPATHSAGDDDESLPPMGMRVRLKASFSEAGLSGPTLVIVKAMKKYGMILADNGSNWYVSGEQDEAWESDMDDLVSKLGKVKGSDFEIVKTGEFIPQPDD
jgi:hypothetical protein